MKARIAFSDMLCFAFQLIHDSHAVASKLRKPPSDDETDTDEAAILQAVQLDKMIAKTNEALALQHVLESYRRYANLNRQQLELITRTDKAYKQLRHAVKSLKDANNVNEANDIATRLKRVLTEQKLLEEADQLAELADKWHNTGVFAEEAELIDSSSVRLREAALLQMQLQEATLESELWDRAKQCFIKFDATKTALEEHDFQSVIADVQHLRGMYESLELLDEQYRGNKVKPIYSYFLQSRMRTIKLQETMDEALIHFPRLLLIVPRSYRAGVC